MWRQILIKTPKNRVFRSFSSAFQQLEAVKDAPEYPPIVDLASEARQARKKQEWFDKIQRIPTIEEKLMELNMPRFWGYRCLMLNDYNYPYNALPFIQYVTKTDFQQMPENNPEETKKVDEFLSLVKTELQDALEFELSGYSHGYGVNKDKVRSSAIVKHLNRVLTRILGADNSHLYESDVDIDPRVEAFWFVGGITPPLNVIRFRKRNKYNEDAVEEPVNRGFQYVGKPLLTLRHQYPLEIFDNFDFDTLTAPNENIPMQVATDVDPRAAGWKTDHRHGVTVPGFWPGNVREYGLLSYYDRSRLMKRPDSYGAEDNKLALHAQAITSSYSYTLGQACYHGFSTFNDITYPLTTQTIITDGKIWSFYRYQLNTTIMHTNSGVYEPNHKYNQCWGTDEMQLYEHVDDNGKIHGLNDEVFKQLIRFYLAEPKARSYEMKPYLDEKEKKIADIEHVERREWLERHYKHLVTNRPRQISVPEIYNWEKIYKIDHQTRPMDKKRRFFEFKINPFNRRLDEHIPEYIPRCLRAGGIYDKKKYKSSYYPLDHRSNDPKTQKNSEFGAAKEGIRRKYDRFRKFNM